MVDTHTRVCTLSGDVGAIFFLNLYGKQPRDPSGRTHTFAVLNVVDILPRLTHFVNHVRRDRKADSGPATAAS